MDDELKPRRQRRCAESPEGHSFDDDGKCTNCELTVHPAPGAAHPSQIKEDR